MYGENEQQTYAGSTVNIFGLGRVSAETFVQEIKESVERTPLNQRQKEKRAATGIVERLRGTNEPIDGERIGDVADIRKVISLINDGLPFAYTLYGCCGQHCYDTEDVDSINKLKHTPHISTEEQRRILSIATQEHPVKKVYVVLTGMQLHMNFLEHEHLERFLYGMFDIISDYPELIVDTSKFLWIGLEYSGHVKIIEKETAEEVNNKTRIFFSKLEDLAQQYI